jgi:hypothetical protein
MRGACQRSRGQSRPGHARTYTAHQVLKADVLDAIDIQLRPVLLGQGRDCPTAIPPTTSNSSWSECSKRQRGFTCATRSTAGDPPATSPFAAHLPIS